MPGQSSKEERYQRIRQRWVDPYSMKYRPKENEALVNRANSLINRQVLSQYRTIASGGLAVDRSKSVRHSTAKDACLSVASGCYESAVPASLLELKFDRFV